MNECKKQDDTKQTESTEGEENETTLTEENLGSIEETIEAQPDWVMLKGMGRMMKQAQEYSNKSKDAGLSFIETSKKLNDFLQGTSKAAKKIGEAIRRMNEEADEATIEALDYVLVEKGFVLDATSTPDDYLDFYNKCKELTKGSKGSDHLQEELYIETITGASTDELVEGLTSQAELLPQGWNDLYIKAAEYIETHGIENGVSMSIYPMFALLENICFGIFELVDKDKLEKIKQPNMHDARTSIVSAIKEGDYLYTPTKTMDEKVLESMKKHVYSGFGRLDTTSIAGRNTILHGHFKFEDIGVTEFLRVYNTINVMNLMRYSLVVNNDKG